MPLSAYQNPIFSNPAVDFLEALATNQASATVNLKLRTMDPLWFIRAIAIIAKENLAFELQLFSRAVNSGATIPDDDFVAVWQFAPLVVGPPASPGYPSAPVDGAANGFFRQYVDGNMIPYFDLDQLNQSNSFADVPLGSGSQGGNARANNAKLHVRLVNRSAASKTAGAPGALQVIFYVANQGQQP